MRLLLAQERTRDASGAARARVGVGLHADVFEEASALFGEAQDQLLRVEAFIGAAQMQEAQRRRGWLRALAPSRLINIVAG